MSAIGSSVITADGINALANASALGKSIKPKYFKFSNQNLTLDPNLSSSDLVGWRTQDISVYQKMNDSTVEFVCDVIPTEATEYTRSCGLYLEDGTLFMVAKPPFPFPPMLRQTFKIQMVYKNADEVLDFSYIPFSETEQDLRILQTSSVLGNLFSKLGAKVTGLSDRVESIFRKTISDKAELERKIEISSEEDEEKINEVAIMTLNSTAVLGKMILDNAEQNRTITT